MWDFDFNIVNIKSIKSKYNYSGAIYDQQKLKAIADLLSGKLLKAACNIIAAQRSMTSAELLLSGSRGL